MKKTDTTLRDSPTYSEKNHLHGVCEWLSPSNIALVKYWGKKHEQLPRNPSISFTLDKARTVTRLEWELKKSTGDQIVDFHFLFHGQPKPEFSARIQKFLNRAALELPELRNYRLHISSKNTFPHSSGIASSASAMSALSAALIDMDAQIKGRPITQPPYKTDLGRRISYLSRLGSGSACRSIFPQTALWGKCSFESSSDEYAVGLKAQLHPVFQQFGDAILLVDQGQKKVSSSAGHQLMENNPFADVRYDQARSNTEKLLNILQTGALDEFTTLVEAEALSLHALMMASTPGYILMHPYTIEVIHHIRGFRQSTGIPVCFTLDAGPNVHLLYPHADRKKVIEFIQSQLLPYCHEGQWIDDQMGMGVQKSNP